MVAHHRIGTVALALVAAVALAGTVVASVPAGDVRLTNDDPSLGGYTSDYTMVTATPYTDPTLTECSGARGRQNEPAVALDPRNTQVIVGSSNDYCGTYNGGVDANGAPIPSGPIWLGYYRSENGGASFTSSLVPGYPGDTSPYASRARIRTASAGDPVLAWDAEGRLFAGAESSGDPAATKKTFGDEWVATFTNPGGPTRRDDQRRQGVRGQCDRDPTARLRPICWVSSTTRPRSRPTAPPVPAMTTSISRTQGSPGIKATRTSTSTGPRITVRVSRTAPS